MINGMKKKLYKILWLDDVKLKRHSKTCAWVSCVFGFVVILIGITVCIGFKSKISEINEFTSEVSQELKNIELKNTPEERLPAIASALLLTHMKFINDYYYKVCVLIVILGLAIISAGIYLFRIHEILNNKS